MPNAYELETSTNPFSLFVMAHLKTKVTHHREEERFDWKTKLIRLLYERGYDESTIRSLYGFIDWIMLLPPEFKKSLNDFVAETEKEKNVRYITSMEEQGIEQGMSGLLQRLLTQTFGDLPEEVTTRLRSASVSEMEAWSDRVLSAESLEDVFSNPS